MNTCSSYFSNPLALQIDRENVEKYGTCDLDTIELIEKYNDKTVEERSDQLADEKAEARFDSIKEDLKLASIKEANEAFLVKKGNAISTSSPFITEYVDVNGQRLFRQDFIPDTFKRNPQYSERQLVKNAYNGHWQKTFKTKGPEFVSEVDVIAGFIVNARALKDCVSYEIYIKGRDAPLHFKNGNLSTHNIMKELQLEDTSLDEKWVAEAFKRSLYMCHNIWFLTIPEHIGGYKLPNGSLTYVSSLSVLPGLEALFSDKIKEHILVSHNRTFDDVTNDYRLALPENWKAKMALIQNVTSILLPFYKEERLKPDRVLVISYSDEYEKQGLIALSKRISYDSTVVKSLADRSTYVKKDLAVANDITVLYTFSSTIEGRASCDSKFTDIRLDMQGENGIENSTRKNVIILTETPGSIQDALPAYYLSFDENIEFSDIKKLQHLTGEFVFSMITFIYNNQEAAKKLVHNAVRQAISYARFIKNAEHTQTMIMTLATAHILKKIGIVSQKEMFSILRWFMQESSSKTTGSDGIIRDIIKTVNDAICSGKIAVAAQYGPPYYKDGVRSAFVAEIDNSINTEVDTFDKAFLSDIKSTDKRNMALRALSDKHLLHSRKDHKRDLKVTFEDGRVQSVSVYSLSSSILNKKEREIVENSLISDRFHELNRVPENFYPLIQHKNFNIIAGQIVKDYNAINPFVSICGSPGSGKTDLLMMQAIQRAKAGDTVIILDPTNSFCEYEWSQHKVQKAIVDETVVFWDMSVQGWLVDIIDFNGCSTIQQKRERLFSMLISGSHLTGCNQISILMNAVNIMIEMFEKGENNLYNCIIGAFEDNAAERKVMSRVLSMFNMIAIDQTHHMSWEEILGMRGKIVVVSSGNATVKADVNPLDVILDSFYSYKDSHRSGNVTLVLDEIQTMNLSEGAPIDIVLSKGRKLNISAFLASQRYSNGKDRLGRVFDYCDTKLFYNPMESCIVTVSEKTHIPVDVLRYFDQGDCAVVGQLYSATLGKNIPVRSALIGRTYRPSYVGSYSDEKE